MDGGMMDGMMTGIGGRGAGELPVLRRTQMSWKGAVLGIIAAAAGTAALVLWHPGFGSDEADLIAQGRKLYAEHCAACHGVNLEGQPNWKKPLPSGRMPAPPHDASGHTWHHADGILFRITKEGPAAVVGGGYESDMAGFGDVLSDSDIRAVLAFIRSTWPERERAYQRELSRREGDKGP